jgi:hypothetical protein
MPLTALERIETTVNLRDPARDTILVGGAAITAHLISRGIDDPNPLSDVDVLCPQQFFDNLLRDPASIEQSRSFQLRWPKGGLKARGATNLSIDIYPDLGAQQRGVVPFTACVNMGDLMYPMDYTRCATDFETAACGLRVMRIGEMLRWISIIGRKKDLDKVDSVMPDAVRSQLVSPAEINSIYSEYTHSKKLRDRFPERYYARLDQSLVDAQYLASPVDTTVLQ